MAKTFITDAEMEQLEKQGQAQTPSFISDSEMAKLETKPQAPQPKGFLGNASAFASGVGTGIISTARQSSDTLRKLGEYVPDQVKRNLPQAPLSPLSNAFAITKQISPALSKLEKSVGREDRSLTKVPETTAGKVGYYGERVAEFLSPEGVATTAKLLKKPLTWAAEKAYQSALKPRNIVKDGKVVVSAEEVVATGLKERVWLTKGGVERVADKIENFETQLGDAIEAAKVKGTAIATKGMQEYLDTAKKFFEDQVDVEAAKKAVAEINALGKNFIGKYGKNIPIEVAQKIKVSTGQFLRKYYDQLSAAGIEGQKQATRFLKEKIVEKAPVVGDVNKRLSSLYKFDQALEKARGRIGNLNLLGLAPKIGAAVGGAKGAVIGAVVGLIDNPAIKSGVGIGLNELSKLAEKGAIPLNALLGLIRARLEED